MKTTNSNRVNMINTTTGFCDANTAATTGITGFATVLAVIKGKIVLINSLNQIGDGTTKGVTLDTKAIRKEMTELALKCANATLAYANANNNNTLAALVNYTESKLNGMKKEDVDDACEAIHDATNTNIIGATPFGVSAGDVTDLQTSIDLFRTASQNPRQALISKSQAKKQADTMIREVIKNLLAGQLDKMANTLKFTNADFWSGYHQAREIIDLGKTTAKVRGTVLDENDAPIKGVEFVIYTTGTTTKLGETETDVKGKYGISKLPAGNVDLEWSKDGYKTVKELDVHISAGKDLRRKVVMDKAVIVEGDVNPGKVENLNGIVVNITAGTVLTLEVQGSDLVFYASDSPTGLPLTTHLDVAAGESITKTAEELIPLLGINDTNHFVNVQNTALFAGHYKITILV